MANSNITLHETEKADLNVFFQFQLDQEGQHLAAFMPENPTDEAAYLEKYAKLLLNPTVNMRTIKMGDVIVGSISKFEIENEAEITYWIDHRFWGQGIASAALKALLEMEPARPIYGRVAFDNYGSQKTLEKCGFVKIGTNEGFATARQARIEEFVYELAD